MKIIITVTLILFVLINCASFSGGQRASRQKKKELPKQRKVLISPDEVLFIKKFRESGKMDYPLNNLHLLPISSPFGTLYFRGTPEQIRKGIQELKSWGKDVSGLHAMAAFNACQDSKYCKDILHDADDDGVIDTIFIPRNSEDTYCHIKVNSDGTQDSIECEYKEGNIIIKQTIDDNENGYPNQFIYYDPKSNFCITKKDYDTNNNRRIDKSDYYENCKLVRTEFDKNENGTIEEIIYYNQEGKDWSIGGDNVKKANDALEAKKYDEAIGFFEAANQELTKEWGADSNQVCDNLNQIGKAYTTAEKFPYAIKIFNQALDLKECRDWTYTDLLENLVWAYAYSENNRMVIKSGIDAANQYAQTNDGKKNSNIEGLLGYGYYKEKDYQEAYKHSLSAIELTLQYQTESCKGEKQCSYMNPRYFSIFGSTCIHLNKGAEGLIYYKKALEFRSQLNSEQLNSFEFSFAYQTYIAGDPKKAISINERFLNDKGGKEYKYALGNQAFYHLALEDLQTANQFIKTAVAAGLKKEEWDEDIEFFKIYYPKQASLLPEFLKASGQY